MIGKNTIVAVCNAKGGVGKSTLAMHLAWTRLADREGKVALIDAEPGGGLISTWADARACLEVKQIPVLSVSPKKDIKTLMVEAHKEYDNIVIDTPGIITGDIVSALKLSDVAVVPITQSTGTAWKIQGMIEIIELANKSRIESGFTSLKVVYVLNDFLKTATKQIKLAKEALREGYGIECSEVVITRNSVLDVAASLGLTAFEYVKGRNLNNIPHQTIKELHALAEEVF